MKIILTGATGFVGGEVLNRLIADRRVKHVTCLSRREVVAHSSKVKTILIEDFTTYDEALAKEMATHFGCIWGLGGEEAAFASPSNFVNAILPHVEKSFRLCYVSDAATDKDLKALTEQNPKFQATAFRPGGILPINSSVILNKLLAPIVVRVDKLARAMVQEVVLRDPERFRVLTNAQIKRRAAEVL